MASRAYVLPYKAPLRDMNFVMTEVLDGPAHYARMGLATRTLSHSTIVRVFTCTRGSLHSAPLSRHERRA